MHALDGEECPTGKACYPSIAAAEGVLRFIKQKGKAKNQGTLRRAYRCPDCRWIHLTSWTNEGEWWK